MSSKRILTEEDIEEVRNYIKKLRKEGSTTANVPGFLTAAAWTGEEDGEGTKAIDVEDDQYAFSIKPSEKKQHSIKLHEVNYKAFKEDATSTQVQKINRRILEVNKMLREISQALDHSIKLKQESAVDNSRYWKKTNEAFLKMKSRLSEVNKKIGRLANLKELAANAVKDSLYQLLIKAGVQISADDIDYNQVAADQYEFDVMVGGEPYAIDYNKGLLVYQGYDQEVEIGNIDQEMQVIAKLGQIFKQ
jgi:hypothetical protein